MTSSAKFCAVVFVETAGTVTLNVGPPSTAIEKLCACVKLKLVGTGPPDASTETAGAPAATDCIAARPRPVWPEAGAAIVSVLPSPEIAKDSTPPLVRLTTIGGRSAAVSVAFNGSSAD